MLKSEECLFSYSYMISQTELRGKMRFPHAEEDMQMRTAHELAISILKHKAKFIEKMPLRPHGFGPDAEEYHLDLVVLSRSEYEELIRDIQSKAEHSSGFDFTKELLITILFEEMKRRKNDSNEWHGGEYQEQGSVDRRSLGSGRRGGETPICRPGRTTPKSTTNNSDASERKLLPRQCLSVPSKADER